MAVPNPALKPNRAGGSPQVLLSVLVPVFNEAATVGECIRRVRAAPYEKQIVVVDDGSQDGTPEVLQELQSRGVIEFYRHRRNRGKGAAVRTALRHARGRFVIVQDADLEYDPLEYPRLIEPLRQGKAQAVYGSRFLADRGLYARKGMLGLGVRLLNWLVWRWYGVRLTDEATCYKAMSTQLMRSLHLECEGFDFCPEVTAKLCRLGVEILEVPISYRPRRATEGKKLSWRHGWQAVRTLWRFRSWQPLHTNPREIPQEVTR